MGSELRDGALDGAGDDGVAERLVLGFDVVMAVTLSERHELVALRMLGELPDETQEPPRPAPSEEGGMELSVGVDDGEEVGAAGWVDEPLVGGVDLLSVRLVGVLERVAQRPGLEQ
jgi:hypothetical protein